MSIGSNVVMEGKIKHQLKDLPIGKNQTVGYQTYHCNG